MQKTNSSSIIKVYALIITLLGWFAVITQFILFMDNRTTSVQETIIRFFSYFTILSNILVATTFNFVFLQGEKKWSKFFNRPATLTAITVYIIVVGAVYNIILRIIWHPVGLQKLVDELLHSVIPFLAVLFWLLFVPKSSLQWKNSLPWLFYPIGYSIFVAARGALSGFYPYPFVNVPVIGYPRALLNGVVLAGVFLGLSLFLIAVARFLSRKQTLVA
jgi:hypothetical protein